MNPWLHLDGNNIWLNVKVVHLNAFSISAHVKSSLSNKFPKNICICTEYESCHADLGEAEVQGHLWPCLGTRLFLETGMKDLFHWDGGSSQRSR